MVYTILEKCGYLLSSSGLEGFNTHNYARDLFAVFFAWLLIVVILLFVGKFLWNDVLCILIPGVNKAKSVWQILGLYILICLLFGR